MNERDLQATVISICHWLRVDVYHTYRSTRSEPGFPDLCIVGPLGVIFRELKTQRGRLSSAQQHWLDALTEAGADAAVWRPSSLPFIRAEIMARCGRRTGGEVA